jgi:hypothetical protein
MQLGSKGKSLDILVQNFSIYQGLVHDQLVMAFPDPTINSAKARLMQGSNSTAGRSSNLFAKGAEVHLLFTTLASDWIHSVESIRLIHDTTITTVPSFQTMYNHTQVFSSFTLPKVGDQVQILVELRCMGRDDANYTTYLALSIQVDNRLGTWTIVAIVAAVGSVLLCIYCYRRWRRRRQFWESVSGYFSTPKNEVDLKQEIEIWSRRSMQN